MIYLAELDDLDFSAGHETTDAQLFAEEDIPWQELAFQSIHNALNFYFEDRKADEFPLRHIEINTPPGRYIK